ncbi:hypothetical protein AcW1_003075 [Taiwanofungus camphoratus]|nr:hypothetical protein AcV5_001735 [Antrodia cinnamomea]KAI0942443.1 hypothetical protein AcW1_003075 [Antrodia cinnamomea]
MAAWSWYCASDTVCSIDMLGVARLFILLRIFSILQQEIPSVRVTQRPVAKPVPYLYLTVTDNALVAEDSVSFAVTDQQFSTLGLRIYCAMHQRY